MTDNVTPHHRGEISNDHKIDSLDLRKTSVRNVLPTHFINAYPDFVQFLETYYEFLESDQGLDRMLERLRDIRDVDIARDESIDKLNAEYGPDIPSSGAMDDATALKMFQRFYQAKGSKEAIEAYFRLFLNTDAHVEYPKDNMLIASGGNWDADRGDWKDSQGKLSEVSMVLQDSYYYQQFSYLVKSGISMVDWGDQFKKVAHPAGWQLFGEVELTELARFEQFQETTREGTRSPTIVSGSQALDVDIIILGAVLAIAIGQFDPSTSPMTMEGIQQFIVKCWKVLVPPAPDVTIADANKNILSSTYSLYNLKDYSLADFLSENAGDVHGVSQRPARIEIISL